ncbi:MAG: hypothetical protein NTZ38_02730 [Candidatus Taylorbacteria bacterium]|nr:hypothetical protein [Candidatus Taylorbacteria bacterium]
MSDKPLKTPDDVHDVAKGNTGNAIAGMRSHSPDAVMTYIGERARTYPKYQASKWDCEDFAFLAASEVRCRYPGQPVGIAIGIGREGEGIAGKDHAINVLWFESDEGGQKKWAPKYFDATLKREVTFDAEVIIALPVLGSTNPALYTRLPTFDNNNFPFLPIAAFVLDDSYDFNSMNAVVDTLGKSDGLELCHGPTGVEERELFRIPYWTPSDETFWWFSHVRKMHMGAPVGVAFGTATHPQVPNGFEYSSLVLWSQENSFRYWDVGAAKYADQLDYTFKPRVVIV